MEKRGKSGMCVVVTVAVRVVEDEFVVEMVEITVGWFWFCL